MAWTAADLTSVETMIRNIISGGGVKSYSINGRSYMRENLSDLLKLRSEIQYEVMRGNSESEFLLADLSGAASHRRFELGGL
jgi:hypothetical protein